MKRIRLRVAVVNCLLLLLAGLAWVYVVPARVGGFTTYVVTSGVSMEPRFHSGDLALVRPADQYRVGDIVAYHSSLLHLVVLHRIVAIHDGHYTFKGDNNNFLDPVHPTRADLIGQLWLHVPHGGVVLAALHNPVFDAVVFAVLGLLVLSGIGGKQLRRKRRRVDGSGSGRQGHPRVIKRHDHEFERAVNFGALLATAAVALAVFLAMAAIVFTRPADRSARLSTPYTQQATFGYSAHVRPGPVYPNGTITTNDPIFTSIVHRLNVHIDYRFTSAATVAITGTEKVLLTLAGPSGWSRSIVLTPSTHFVGNHTSTDVTLDLRQLQSAMAQVERLTRNVAFSTFSFTIYPLVHVNGTVGGHPVTTSYAPGLGFQFQPGQLQPAAAAPSGSTASSGSQSAQGPNYTPSQTGSVGTRASAPATITVLGASPEISLLRWIAVIGLLFSVVATVYFYVRKRSEPFEETFRIRAQYGHLIVPIMGGEDLGWPPVDVPNIQALVRLAESGQRLILHNRSGDVDTYMVNEEGTVYRYQVKPSKVVWGEWSGAPAPLEEAA